MRRHLLLALGALPILALASVPLQATLQELVDGADHILIGRITGVDMIDKNGLQISDPQAMTGPGLTTQIRLLVQVDEVLVSQAKTVPKHLWVPLDNAMHYSLGQVRSVHQKVSPPLLVFLKGDRFEPIKPGVFLRPLSDKQATLKLRRAHR